MRLRHTAALGLAAGALVLSGGLAMADSSGGTSDDAADATPTESTATATAPAEGWAAGTATTESGTTAGRGYGFATADGEGGVSSFSVAVPGDDGPGDGKGQVRRMAVNGHELSDEQRECMEKNGATPPDFKEQPTREQMEAHRAKVEAAMDECGIDHPEPGEPGKPGPGGPDGPVMIVNGTQLTDEQRQCMEENAPAPPAPNGERPTREDMEKTRSGMEAAMDKCGIDHPKAGEAGPRGDVFFGTAPEGETRTAPATLTPATPRGA